MGIGQQFIKATNSDMPQNAGREQGLQQPYLEVLYDGKSELVQIPEPDFLDDVEGSFLELIELRSSVRQYSGEEMTLKQLSLLLWCTQGVKMVTDRTVRNVPSAGGRHAFETYLLIRNVEGITPGVYRFLAIEHLLVKVGGEEMMNECMDCYREWKEKNLPRSEFLKMVSKIEGIYVPSFYDVKYNADGTVKSIEPINDEVPPTVKKRVVEDLDNVYYPDNIIVPFIEIVHDRIMLEVFRGCIRGCRFCQAGMIYRPVREKSASTLLDCAQKLIDNTGYNEISLSSLSTSDYTQLADFSDKLLAMTEDKKVSLSLPSLRLDSFSMDLMNKVNKVRKSSLTFAPEAGTQRMRDVINKGITEEDLMNSSKMAFEGGYSSIKLYFMMGLPFETIEDVCGIADLSKKVVRQYFSVPKEKRSPGLRVTASVSSFVPKAFTPFQWAKQNTMDELRTKQYALKECMDDKRVKYNYHEAPVSVLEGVFARGDRRLADVLLAAHKKGIRFDGWSQFFSMEKWQEAFQECGLNMDFYTRERSFDEILPWDMIDVGVRKDFLISEAKKAQQGIVTPNCRQKCSACGANCYKGGVCYE